MVPGFWEHVLMFVYKKIPLSYISLFSAYFHIITDKTKARFLVFLYLVPTFTPHYIITDKGPLQLYCTATEAR